MIIDPLHRLSTHFIVADFLGCHSVYSRGLKNSLEGSKAEVELRLANAMALCEEVLEPLLAEYGPLSIGYGYISPDTSRALVKYQDPNLPSHHRWDLGAAADICVHNWVEANLPWPDNQPGDSTSPVWLAHMIDQAGIPYSRIITYSESPFLCVAVAAREVAAGTPRKAFYENRFMGVPRAKPDYRTYASDNVRKREFGALTEQGLPFPWQGAGYPTYHGGGRQQYHHQRCSVYTMVSDWLLDLQSIANGYKNIPSLNLDSVQDAIGAAGITYDRLIDASGIKRMSIVSGYVSHVNPEFNPNNDWREGRICFKVIPPDLAMGYEALSEAAEEVGVDIEWDNDGGAWIAADVEEVYAAQEA